MYCFTIVTFYDLIFVFSSLPGKREYFEIHLQKKCTKLTPEELKAIALMSLVTLKKKAIALMSLVTLKKNFIRSYIVQ